MIRPVGDLDQYKYTISDIVFSKKGSNEPFVILARQVHSITIIHKYVDNIIPIVNIVASVDKEIYKELTMSEGLLSAKLSLYKYISNSSTQARQLVISKTFSVLNEYDFQPKEIRMLLGEKIQEDAITGTNTGQLTEVSFYLIDKDNLTKYRKNMSLSLANASMTDALAASFKQRGFNSVLMNRITEEYRGRIFVPLSNLLSTLEYLNTMYGIFNTDYVFYMDLNETYLLDKVNLGKAVKEKNIASVNLYLEEDTSVYAVDTGSTVDKDSAIVNMTNPPELLKLDNYSEYLQGSSIISVDANYNVMKISGGEGSLERAITVMNHKVSKQIQHRSNEMKYSLSVNLVDVDYSIIAPNLLYNVFTHSSYDKYTPIKGKYRLHESTVLFARSTDDTLDMKASLVLRRIV